VKTIGDDYRRFGYEVEIVHSALFVDELLRDASFVSGGSQVRLKPDAAGTGSSATRNVAEATTDTGRGLEVGDSSVVSGFTRTAGDERVTFHDPCYLGRYGGIVDEPRHLLSSAGATIAEPIRNRENPYCCGAGGGLLFADKEEEPGSRISDVRFKQLQATGARTVVTACPFCSIMLKGAHASAGSAGGEVQFVDLMTYVNGRLVKA
jgi:Fe-S oxidoreductase